MGNVRILLLKPIGTAQASHTVLKVIETEGTPLLNHQLQALADKHEASSWVIERVQKIGDDELHTFSWGS